MLGRGVTSFGWKWIEAKNDCFILNCQQRGQETPWGYNIYGVSIFYSKDVYNKETSSLNFLGFMYNLKPRK